MDEVIVYDIIDCGILSYRYMFGYGIYTSNKSINYHEVSDTLMIANDRFTFAYTYFNLLYVDVYSEYLKWKMINGR